jgi:hypothetical protein
VALSLSHQRKKRKNNNNNEKRKNNLKIEKIYKTIKNIKISGPDIVKFQS